MREPEKGTRRRCGRPERYAARGRETGPRPRGETARPAPEIDQPLPRAISTFAIVPVDLAEEVLLPCEPEHCEQAAQQRVGSVLEHVVGIAAGHHVPWAAVGGAAAGRLSQSRVAGRASSSMKTTISPAAAAMPMLRGRLKLRSGLLATLMRHAYWASTASVSSVEGPLTTTTSKEGWSRCWKLS